MSLSAQTMEFFETLSKILLRCWLFGFAVLLISFVAFMVAGDMIHQTHGPMFGITKHEMDLIFYCGMGLLKLSVFICFFFPWLAIRMVLKQG